jgi:cell division septation protein DedD
MPRNDDGEFELILGNRQLLSVFFIVVILLGVFFTLGYIVGRNSSPIAAEAHKPSGADSASRNPSGGGSASTPQESTPAAADAPKTPEATERPSPTPEEKAEPSKASEKPRPASPISDQPSPGETYLQVAAVQKTEAQLFVDVLAKKGFHALYAAVPDKPTTFRVLVGPLKDSAAIAQARTDLQKAGFKGFDSIKRTY